MPSQKALFLQEKQGAFVVGTRDIPSPKPDEILVKIKATALNPVDWKLKKYGPPLIQSYPAIVGADIAGDIVEIGADVQGFKVGDRVLFQGSWGDDYAAFQQYAKVPAEIAAKIPESVSYSQAASVPAGLAAAAIGLFWTITGAGLNPNLDKNVQFTGQSAVVIGGSASIGQYAIQLLRWAGFSAIIAYASGHHTDVLKVLGATHIIDRKSVDINDLATEVKKLTDKPVKVVFDAISVSDTQEAGYAALAEGGDLIVALPSEIKSPVESKKVAVLWGNVHPEVYRPFGRALYRKLTQFLEDGTIVPNKVEELPNGLAGIPDGLERLRNDQVSGKKLVALPQETS
ncbi:hypothetical protein V5O48_018847 [Marasmius crinis-equi]|uniref:Enoyl reductase (ER) domain-containing protein n=1 Tax=Marasmius crinis-equi TaxID=585013 RepID=A0ABR3EK59_9AGAR